MPLTILVITQNDELSERLCRFLRNEGQRPLTVSGEKNILLQTVEMRPELIIVEISMPELAGIETVNRLHTSFSTSHIPIIVISDFPELEFELLHLFDFICKPVDLKRLREDVRMISEGRKKRLPSVKQQLTNEEHRKFHDFLIMHSGLHFERRNIKVLERGLASRMAALRITLFSDYFAFLEENMESRQELQKLLQLLTIGETFFFRYHAHFDALATNVLPSIAKLSPEKSIRIWSAGCSTGEEAYTLAITIIETLPDWKTRDIKIYATDINNRSLRRAREGVYNAWKIRVTQKHYLDKYFNRIGESYIVKDEVKSLVEFSYFNLQAPLLLPATSFDIIFCRNVMIYFTTVTTKKVVEMFADNLNPGGYLFLGHSETLANVSSNFERHIHEGGFFYTKKTEPPAHVKNPEESLPLTTRANSTSVQTAVNQSRKTESRPPVKPTISLSPEALFAKGQGLMLQESYKAAAEVFRELLRMQPDHTGAILATGQINLMNAKGEEALSCFDRALELNDLLPEAYFLRGLFFELNDKAELALEEYRKAVLLKMDFVMPHYHLGKLCFRTGDVKTSAREFRNSIKLLEKADREAHIPFSGGLSREVFLEQVRKDMAMAAAASID